MQVICGSILEVRQTAGKQKFSRSATERRTSITETPFAVRAVFGLALVIGGAAPAHAGPPFMTDDPEPIDCRHSEAYLFSAFDKQSGGCTLLAPAFEFNYGAAPDRHLHAMVPFVQLQPADGHDAHGLGDIELGVKYRFIHEAPGVKNSTFAGWLVQRKFGARLVLGGELFYQEAAQAAGKDFALLNVGGNYQDIPVCGGCSLLVRVGASIAGEVHHDAYLGLYWTWGPDSTHR